MYIRIYIYVYTCIHTYICIYTHICIYIYTYIYTCMFIYTHTHTHTHIYKGLSCGKTGASFADSHECHNLLLPRRETDAHIYSVWFVCMALLQKYRALLWTHVNITIFGCDDTAHAHIYSVQFGHVSCRNVFSSHGCSF